MKMIQQEGVDLLKETVNDLNALLLQLAEIPETLGSSEDIMIDAAAMTLLDTSIESVIARIQSTQRKLQQAIDKRPPSH